MVDLKAHIRGSLPAVLAGEVVAGKDFPA